MYEINQEDIDFGYYRIVFDFRRTKHPCCLGTVLVLEG
jgi:hypothetical protein